MRYPFRPGHATVGRVVAVGEGVEGIAPGKRVATRSGHGSHIVIKAENAYPIPDEVAADDAIWFALAKIAGHGARAAQITLGQSVVVIGAGPIGQMAVRCPRGVSPAARSALTGRLHGRVEQAYGRRSWNAYRSCPAWRARRASCSALARPSPHGGFIVGNSHVERGR